MSLSLFQSLSGSYILTFVLHSYLCPCSFLWPWTALNASWKPSRRSKKRSRPTPSRQSSSSWLRWWQNKMRRTTPRRDRRTKWWWRRQRDNQRLHLLQMVKTYYFAASGNLCSVFSGIHVHILNVTLNYFPQIFLCYWCELYHTVWWAAVMFMLQTTPVTTVMTWTQTTWPVCSTPGRKPPQMSVSGLPVNSIPARSSTPLWTFPWLCPVSLSPRLRLQRRLPWTSKLTSLLVRWGVQTFQVHEAETFDFHFHPEEFKTLS